MCDECFFDVYFPEDAQIFETDIRRFPLICRRNIEENMQLRDFLKSGELDQKRFDTIVKEVTEKIDCTTCGNCCKVLKPSLNREDIKRIAKYLRMTTDTFISCYVTKDSEGGYEFKHSSCSFLQDNNTCRIYEVRPDECKGYPHLDKDITTRCIQFFANAEVCPIVFNVIENAKEEFLEDIYDFMIPDEED
jgi:Fe-S-cluster containining protein